MTATETMTNRYVEVDPLSDGAAPEWARAWGRDRFGVFADLVVGEVRHRFRWIPRGTFTMGSPEGELGRYLDEVEHEVTIPSGFWFGEGPCSQALWLEVMGENPSRFKGHDRPVENVTWRDTRSFFSKLNDRVEGLETRLPTEEEWEYACRAGTKTATYEGDLTTEYARDPVLDRIAWYDENSGNETHPIGELLPNRHGLFDMLGNVWEWCDDVYAAYDESSADDDTDDEDEADGRLRVIRGGSWLVVAGLVRAAYRSPVLPSHRHGGRGFRLARGHGAQGGARENAEHSVEDAGEARPEAGRGTRPDRGKRSRS